MKRKTINAVISKKFDEWRESIADAALKDMVDKNTICTGGCIASMLLREPVNDFDFYFRTRDIALAVARYYVQKFKDVKPDDRKHIHLKEAEDRIYIVVQSAGVASEDDSYAYDAASQLSAEEQKEIATLIEEGEAMLGKTEGDSTENKGKYRPVFLSRNAISLSEDVQLVIRFWGDPDQIHDTYDFWHCCNYWDSRSREVTLRHEAMEALLTKELKYRGSKYPLCSLFRMKKFIQRGWQVNCGTILKIVWNLKDYDLTSIPVLEEQLTGVDISFFLSVIEQLQQFNKSEGKNADYVDSNYLMQLIDKMF